VIETLHTPRFLEGLDRAERKFSAVVDGLRTPSGSGSKRFWYYQSVADDFRTAYAALDGLYPPHGASKPLTDAMDRIQAAVDLADGISGATIRGEPLSPERIQAAFRTQRHRLNAALERARAAVAAG
jgi:hypothetical protein